MSAGDLVARVIGVAIIIFGALFHGMAVLFPIADQPPTNTDFKMFGGLMVLVGWALLRTIRAPDSNRSGKRRP